MKYIKLSEEIENQIKNTINLPVENPIRRDENHDKASLWRPAYVRDIEKIMHCPYYNRYSDKTQVFSFYKNDDLSRRALHVQLVSRIARNIGKMLGLNLDLIEAIALGHDMGHTPFGHTGEKILSNIYNEKTGRYFNHNVHSVRVLDKMLGYNITLQTLSGILCHNGEMELKEYYPKKLESFDKFDEIVENCYTIKDYSSCLVPSTLEGCVVRICDIIAYIGKDRQDAIKTKLISDENVFSDSHIGKFNAMIINNLIVNIVENSFGKDYIKLDEEYFEALKQCKRDNYDLIYLSDNVGQKNYKIVEPMFCKLYDKLLSDLKSGDESTLIFKHHIEYVENLTKYYKNANYRETEPNQIVVDYIASMTDDYFVELFEKYFPNENRIKYISYFDQE
jgi:dGTPase